LARDSDLHDPGPPSSEAWPKRRPQPQLRAHDGEPDVADWASLFGDLARPTVPPSGAPSPVEWRVHDRTHLEFAIDYPIRGQATALVWEAFFFVPESFRLHGDSYDKKAIFEDLWSYVRHAVPEVPFGALALVEGASPLGRVRDALAGCRGQPEGSAAVAEATRQLRLFACLVRASGVEAMRRVESERAGAQGEGAEGEGAALWQAGSSFAAEVAEVPGAFRAVVSEAGKLPDAVATAARWADEDISMVLETLCASLGVALGQQGREVPRRLAATLAAAAVAEARHRQRQGYDSVGHGGDGERQAEHLEFRRHVLKRFTSSVLWLSLRVHTGAAWVVHVLYAVAAAVAMAFALFASFPTVGATSENLARYALLAVIAYAIKDRLKAVLQNAFAAWVSGRFPDRKWIIRDHERGRDVGRVLERVGFRGFEGLPAGVLEARRMTREHSLEEAARPERVLWHQKAVQVAPRAVKGDSFPMLTEIFRLNLRRWLLHTDDPNRKMVFADPDDAHIYSVVARRVYNINVVYRLQPQGDADAPWHRLRVVVSRKGIERIDSIC